MANESARTADKILADIEIARANLYVFGDSSEKEKWLTLLNKAEEAIEERPQYSERLLNRVEEVVSKLWDRISRWKDVQKKVTGYFTVILLLEILAVSVFYFYIDLVAWGLYTALLFGLLGGTMSVILSLGANLRIEDSNQLSILRLVLRPLIGSVSALILFSLLQLEVVQITGSLNPAFTLILLSIGAGYSERFFTSALDNYLPKLIK